MLKLGKNYLLLQLLAMGMQEGAAGGLPGEPGLCLVVALCSSATVQSTDHGCCGAIYPFILQLSGKSVLSGFKSWQGRWGLPVSGNEKPPSPLHSLAHGRRLLLIVKASG